MRKPLLFLPVLLIILLALLSACQNVYNPLIFLSPEYVLVSGENDSSMVHLYINANLHPSSSSPNYEASNLCYDIDLTIQEYTLNDVIQNSYDISFRNDYFDPEVNQPVFIIELYIDGSFSVSDVITLQCMIRAKATDSADDSIIYCDTYMRQVFNYVCL